MNIHGTAFSETASKDIPELRERFWFWRGASGQNYIHSVYTPETCPPLPGAVYVGVKRHGAMRTAMVVGRFDPHLEGGLPSVFRHFDEIHVHLLARAPGAAESVRNDLAVALGEDGELETKSAFRVAA
ncbi:hypothetical protein [Aestuariivirga litoralis]|uniref:hypothetical protein n=1 Tax=Aestuariivirga litoralis TaxID=2650924 RepID=UPI0018C50D45|nr:hypothetical protein [Aestuariivirga litoralis]MBG1233708.1 hypothetical protein [Aestuariivirga litoralis]